jgi:hypothetical protein
MKGFGKLFTVLLLNGCGGGGGGPGSPNTVPGGDFPVVNAGSSTGYCSLPPGPTTYMIVGLSDRVADLSTPTLEARLEAGDTVGIHVEGYGCGLPPRNQQYESTNPPAAFLVPDTGVFKGSAELTANAAGRTQIFANFKAGDGNTYRTTLAYCPPDPGCLAAEGCPCSSPRRIDKVTVTWRK